MGKYRKWLGGGLGWVLGGPLGGILGFALGSILDGAQDVKSFQETTARNHTRPGDFEVSMLVLAAYVMKADGKITQSEKDFVQQTFVQLFGKERANQAFRLFNEVAKQDQYSLRDICVQIRTYMDHPSRLQLVHFLFKLCMADGHVHPKEHEMVERIAMYLRINPRDVESLRAMFAQDPAANYKILEVEEDCTDEELKKAYRKMVKKYHPDKVQHLGDEMMKEAEEKFKKVQEAYDNICKQRGLN